MFSSQSRTANRFLIQDTKLVTKIISKAGLLPWQVRGDILVEAEILMKLNHDNIVACVDIYQNSDYFHLVLEFCQGKTLYDLIEEQSALSEETAHTIYTQVNSNFQSVYENFVLKGFVSFVTSAQPKHCSWRYQR